MHSSEASYITYSSKAAMSLDTTFTEIIKPFDKKVPDLVYTNITELDQTFTEIATPQIDRECEHPMPTIDYQSSIEPLIDTFQRMMRDAAQKICQDLGSEFDIDLQGNIKIVLNDGCKNRIMMSIYDSQKCPHLVECKNPISSVDISL